VSLIKGRPNEISNIPVCDCDRILHQIGVVAATLPEYPSKMDRTVMA